MVGGDDAGETLRGVTRSGISSGVSCGLRGRMGDDEPPGMVLMMVLW